ncbi:hypothetical protein OTU49_007639, partial [Cherax quadricarinatus]
KKFTSCLWPYELQQEKELSHVRLHLSPGTKDHHNTRMMMKATKELQPQEMKGKKWKTRSKTNLSIKNDMDKILSDPRFAHVSSDLKLRHIPKEKRKVKLDSRFHSVLTDDKFYEKSIMDPRGRKGNYSTKEDLLKFYHMS